MLELRPRARHIEVTNAWITVDVVDGRRIAHPGALYPRPRDGSPDARGRWVLIGEGEGIHWPEFD